VRGFQSAMGQILLRVKGITKGREWDHSVFQFHEKIKDVQ